MIEVVPINNDGQDISFVIDTTGSMRDDIASVKSSASEIIDSVFDEERGLPNSRISVVAYNDPESGDDGYKSTTILSFTDHDNPDERKSAALEAINSINVFGGGDIPEYTYEGILHALDGRAGAWRDDALARKIIIFGDAPAKDPETKERVIALANNLNATLSSSRAIAPGVVSTTYEISGFSEREINSSVQIFAIQIGSDVTVAEEFEDISVQTGGGFSNVSDSTEIVEAIMEVIELPIYRISVSSDEVVEGNSGVSSVDILIERDNANQASVVSLGIAGTADIDDRSLSATSVNFLAGESSQTIQLDIQGDTLMEDDETVNISIQDISENASTGVGEVSLIILNDDIDPCGNSTDVFRFYNAGNNVHFFTPSPVEKDDIISKPEWGYKYEGVAYKAPTDIGTELYRFYNRDKGYHFMTASKAEADSLTGKPEWGYNYEGRSYKVTTEATSETPNEVYRFYNREKGIHFYSASDTEANNIIANSLGSGYDLSNARNEDNLLPNGWGYIYEGTAWYVTDC